MKLCVYCGNLATTRDHVWPRSRRIASNGKTVPACAECNILLSNHPVLSVRERAEFLIPLHIGRGSSLERLKWLRAVALIDPEDLPLRPSWTDEDPLMRGDNFALLEENRADDMILLLWSIQRLWPARKKHGLVPARKGRSSFSRGSGHVPS